MAQFAVQRTPQSMLAVAASLAFGTFLLLIVVATAYVAPAEREAHGDESALSPGVATVKHLRDGIGGEIYLYAIGLMLLGFWAKEDHVVMLGVMGLCFAFVLDVYLGQFGLLGPFSHGGH